MEIVASIELHLRKPGRPRAITKELEPAVIELYDQGNGYRVISRLLGEEYGLDHDYTLVRRILIRLGRGKKGDQKK